MEIAKINYRFLNPNPSRMISFWKSQTFYKIPWLLVHKFFLAILKSICWYGFSSGVLVVLNVFHQYKRRFIK
jgi:hypothetical protein